MAQVLAPDAGIPFPLYGVPTRISFCIFDTTGAEVTAAADLDSEISLDGDTAGDCTNEAAAQGDGWYNLVLTAAETAVSHASGRTKTSTATALSAMWEIYPVVLPAINSGTAQSGTDGGIVLQAANGLQTVANVYNGCFIVLTGGTGAGQSRVVTSWGGANLTAAVSPNWATNPANDSTYQVLQSPINNRLSAFAQVTADTVYEELVGDHNTANTFGALITAINAKTTNLPASPAATGAKMDLVDAPNGTAVTALQAGLAVPGDQMDLQDAPNATAVTAIQAGLALDGGEMDLVDAPNGTAIAAVQNGLATGTALTTVGNNVVAVKTVTDNVAGMYETDGPVKRYTANALEQAPTGVSTAAAEDIADAVWDEDKADHDAAGSMGELQGDTDLTVRELGYQRPP